MDLPEMLVQGMKEDCVVGEVKKKGLPEMMF